MNQRSLVEDYNKKTIVSQKDSHLDAFTFPSKNQEDEEIPEEEGIPEDFQVEDDSNLMVSLAYITESSEEQPIFYKRFNTLYFYNLRLQYIENEHLRAKTVQSLCKSLYDENPPADSKYKCWKYWGYDSFMLNSNFMMSVPNKCASQFLNQFAFNILGLKDSDLAKGTSMYSYRSSVQSKAMFFKIHET